jgi:hypothetical protein
MSVAKTERESAGKANLFTIAAPVPGLFSPMYPATPEFAIPAAPPGDTDKPVAKADLESEGKANLSIEVLLEPPAK